MSKLIINIISQEKKLAEIEADSLTAPTTEGEITVLPGHLPLFTRLKTGELTYRNAGSKELFAISQGFLDVGLNNSITIIVDSLSNTRNLNTVEIQKAIQKAQESLKHGKESGLAQEELVKIEASLKQALLEEKLAHKTTKTKL
ncbi:MAG: ATP synthase F1 subunit epsilon [Patescibacteria group bacterium]